MKNILLISLILIFLLPSGLHCQVIDKGIYREARSHPCFTLYLYDANKRELEITSEFPLDSIYIGNLRGQAFKVVKPPNKPESYKFNTIFAEVFVDTVYLIRVNNYQIVKIQSKYRAKLPDEVEEF